MITIYNSNLDFDLDSSNSITLSSTSNMVFKTNGSDKMSIVNNGISVSGNVVVSGLITSTGAGFSGIGANLTNIPISAINELRLELNGGTTDLSVTRDTLNARIVSEAGFGSNYTSRINSELNTRVDNTSNYVLATSNILIGRIINTSNYVDSTSNFLSVRIDNTSNYALATSNILIGRIINTSNYVDSTSNFLSSRIDNTSNYALATSNILIGRIINTSNYVDSTSNFLGGRIDNTSNYVNSTSNILIGRIINTCNYVDNTSNFLSGRIDNTSNYVLATSNILIGRIDNTSNYVLATSNILIGRLINTSNYVDSTSNFLSGRIDNTSNYALATSNILIGRLINTSNYVYSTSNFLSGRIDNTSNYVESTSNTLIGRIINTSNYVDSTSNFLARRIDNASSWGSNYTDKADIWGSNYSDRVGGWGSNYAYDKVGVWSSNYTDRVGGWGSNYAYDKVGVWGSNYAYDKVGVWSSNYTDRVGVWGSNYAYDKVGVWSSNYTDRVGGWGSNYAYDKVGVWGSNYTDRIGERTSNYVLATSNILIGRIINTSNYVSSYKPATAITADFANRFTNSVNIAGVPFNGTANISISYNSLDNQLSFGNGLSTSYDNITNITSVTANAAPQEQSDWTQTSTSSASFIKNKPTIPVNTFQLNGSIAFYNSGNVGIGTNAPLSLLEIITANYTGALLTLDAGVVNSTTQMPRSIGRPLLKLGKTSYSTSAGDYYGIGFGISPTLSDYNCAEIGTIITSTAGLETGDIIFSTRPGTNNVIATERMRITSAGNVAIGTTDTTSYKLNVGGDINIASGSSFRVGGNVLSTFTPSSANLIGSFNTSQFENVSSAIQIKSSWKPTTAGTADSANALAAGTSISTGTITTTGNVGIGTTDISIFKLNVKGTTKSDGNLDVVGYIYVTNSISINTQDVTSYTLNVNGTGYISGIATVGGIYSSGNVGLGVTPTTRLDVESSPTISFPMNTNTYIINNGLSTVNSATHGGICARFRGALWSGAAIISSSDIRIKEDICDINDDSALQLILAIEPKTYKYIDKLSRGSNKVYGFIAQQIREVIPDAVNIEKCLVPNIYLVANYDNNIITLPSQPTYIIKLNDEIKCYDKDNKQILVEVVEIIDDLTFKIKDIEYADTKIFVYGKEVDDFHTLNKDYIFTLNVCATQELHRKIEAQNVIIRAHEEHIKKLIEINDDKEMRIKNIELLLNISNNSSN